MRRFTRPDLAKNVADALARKQARANKKHAAGTLDVQVTWKSARGTKPLQAALDALKGMTGIRERCMYCGDSHGTDIEYFWPKAPYPERMFRWPNFLLCCTDCGRIKGTDFPLRNGQPLLVDPTVEDPWLFLDFDPFTGNIVARFIPDTGAWDERGEQTVEVLELDRREALAAGYLKTFRRLSDRVSDFLNEPASDISSFIQTLTEDDDHGLLGWCFRGAGQRVKPFSELLEADPAAWTKCADAFANYY